MALERRKVFQKKKKSLANPYIYTHKTNMVKTKNWYIFFTFSCQNFYFNGPYEFLNNKVTHIKRKSDEKKNDENAMQAAHTCTEN